ncbi:MAG: ATP-dependent helicase, partial [Candidatus Omnitrophica bacterium]|nr:ATP-dependent helicase [Candidatus Omnitrophota bacterium]
HDNSVLEQISRRYKFVMVDEYQDTNKLQGEITFLLGKRHKNIMVVGDDAQSIYGFRGANHKNIMDFPRKFPDCKIITLEENYRSTQMILNLSNALLDNMKDKYPKSLISANKRVGEKPKLLYFKDAYKEAEWIAKKVKDLRDSGVKLSEQAVLFRSAYISIPLQAELSKRNIPYQVFGGIKFYETAHVKDLLAHLRIILNPKDELAWNRILLLIEGLGARTVDRILKEIENSLSLEEILSRVFKKYIQENKKYKSGLNRLREIINLTSRPNVNLAEKIKLILDYYQPIFENKFDDYPARESDLKTLQLMAKNYSTLDEFLADLAVEVPERGVLILERGSKEDEKPLCLSTIHSAKGLEWSVVFIIGLVEGVLPISFAFEDQERLEEEERLLYVAVTRAKEQLFLSIPCEGLDSGGYYFNKPCRFINLPNILSRVKIEIASSEEEVREESLIELERE